MRANQIVIGGTYRARVSRHLVSVRISATLSRGGWRALNLKTGRSVTIRTAARLQAPLDLAAKLAADKHPTPAPPPRERIRASAPVPLGVGAIGDAIRETQHRIDALGWSSEIEATKSKLLDMDFLEYVKFQEIKSLAVAQGTLSLADGQYIYAQLGESPATFNGRPYAVKAVLTIIFERLLRQRIRAHQHP